MKRLIWFFLILFMFSNVWAARKALIIGNSNYTVSPLRNPINDANLMAATLRELDFSVTLVTDADLQRLDTSLNEFVTDLRPEDEAVFYFSGHGANFNGENYLIPIGREFREDKELKYYAMSSNLALERMQRAKITVMILDACRDNPFRGVRSANKGLANMSGKAGSQYIIYSTELGKVAADGSGANSPFTESFAKHIKSPERIEDVMKKVTFEVKTKTYDDQIPWVSGNLIEDFYFAVASTNTERVVTPKIPKSSSLEMLTGNVRITSDFETEIFINRKSEGISKPGFALTTGALPIGTNMVEVFWDNAKYGIPITITENQTSALNLSVSVLQNSKSTAKVYTIRSVPENSDLQIVGYPKIISKTPFRIYDPVSSSYKINLSKARYDDLTSEINTDATKSGEVTLTLKAQFANLSISSEPSGSKVWLNDAEIGKTPIQLSGAGLGLSPGKYSLVVEPQNEEYLAVNKELELMANNSYNEQIVHFRSPATISINSDYYPIQIFLDGTPITILNQARSIKTENGAYCLRAVPAGETDIQLKIPEMDIVLAANESKHITLNLLPEKARLNFVANRDDFELLISDTNKGKYQSIDTSFWTGYPGTYNFRAVNWGHYAIDTKLTLKEQESREQHFNFEPIPREFLKPYQSWQTHKKLSIASIAVSLGLSTLFYFRAKQAHEDYLAADSPFAAITARTHFESSRNQFYGICSLNLLSTGYYALSMLKGRQAKKQINREMYSRLED